MAPFFAKNVHRQFLTLCLFDFFSRFNSTVRSKSIQRRRFWNQLQFFSHNQTNNFKSNYRVHGQVIKHLYTNFFFVFKHYWMQFCCFFLCVDSFVSLWHLPVCKQNSSLFGSHKTILFFFSSLIYYSNIVGCKMW